MGTLKNHAWASSSSCFPCRDLGHFACVQNQAFVQGFSFPSLCVVEAVSEVSVESREMNRKVSIGTASVLLLRGSGPQSTGSQPPLQRFRFVPLGGFVGLDAVQNYAPVFPVMPLLRAWRIWWRRWTLNSSSGDAGGISTRDHSAVDPASLCVY